MNELQFLFKINGVGSSSGIWHEKNTLFLISDNSSFLYKFKIIEKELSKLPLLDNSSELIEKSKKPDFEALTKFENLLYVFGSGSEKNRCDLVVFDDENQLITNEVNLTSFYSHLKKTANIDDEDFNIEGICRNKKQWYFFNRGNGKSQRNIIFLVTENDFFETYSIQFIKIELPKIEKIQTSFTDAVFHENKIYFLATAEDTTSTYEDGEVVGTLLGIFDLATQKIIFTKVISKTKKLEGITIFEETNSQLSFLICEDNDTEILESSIYKYTIQK